jgi:hypothetical protein
MKNIKGGEQLSRSCFIRLLVGFSNGSGSTCMTNNNDRAQEHIKAGKGEGEGHSVVERLRDAARIITTPAAVVEKPADKQGLQNTATAARNGDFDGLLKGVTEAYKRAGGNENRFGAFGKALAGELKSDGIEVNTKGRNIAFSKGAESVSLEMGWKLDFRKGEAGYYGIPRTDNHKDPKETVKSFKSSPAKSENQPGGEGEKKDNQRQPNTEEIDRQRQLNPDGSSIIKERNKAGDVTETRIDAQGKFDRSDRISADGKTRETILSEGKKIVEEKKDNGDTNVTVTDTGSGKPVYEAKASQDGSYTYRTYDKDGGVTIVSGKPGSATETTQYGADGKMSSNKMEYPDGSVHEQKVNPDGSIVVKSSNSKGETTETGIDNTGNISHYERRDADGKVVTSPQPDTTRTQPETTRTQPDTTRSKGIATLLNPQASAEEKLLAAREMVVKGQNSFQAEDGRKYQVSIQKYGTREGVVVSTSSEKSQFVPLLRGLINHDGSVSHQRDRAGNEVAYAGSRAAKQLSGDVVLSTKEKPQPQPGSAPEQAPPPRSKPAPEPVPGNGPLGGKLEACPVDPHRGGTCSLNPQETVASVYSRPQPTASGRYFNPGELTVAHKTLPMGTVLEIESKDRKGPDGKPLSVQAVVTDRGPYVGKRGLDLSTAVGKKLGIHEHGNGVGRVVYRVIGRESF